MQDLLRECRKQACLSQEGVASSIAAAEDAVKKLRAELASLRQRPVDQSKIGNIQSVLDSVGDSSLHVSSGERCLHDYVDAESVDALLDNSLRHSQALHAHQSLFLTAIQEVDQLSAEIHGSTLNLRLEPIFQEFAHKKSSVVHTFQALSTRVEQMDARAQRAFRNLTECANSNVVVTDSDSSAREDTLLFLRGVHAQLQEDLEVVLSSANKCRQLAQELMHIHAQLVDEFHQCTKQSDYLRSVEKKAGDYLQRLSETQAQAADSVQQLQPILDDCMSLVQWYSLFQVAYEQLLVEVPRRKAAVARMNDIMQLARTHLQLLHQEEIERRQHFAQFYEDYLPPGFSAEISDPLAQPQVGWESVSHLQSEEEWQDSTLPPSSQ